MSQHRRIVVIMTDTQRRDMIGCYGNKDMKTPNIDKLASEGIRFEKAYTCQPMRTCQICFIPGLYHTPAAGATACLWAIM